MGAYHKLDGHKGGRACKSVRSCIPALTSESSFVPWEKLGAYRPSSLRGEILDIGECLSFFD